ncbi:MAG: Ig-like domain-containing protein [Bacteroidales bacterium]|nr:Ig-like domain-containing protein [Bacteroidales bacterium]
MKTKILWAAAMLALISIVSCNNNEDQVQAVRLDKTKLEIVKGESVQLSAVVVPEQDAEFEWFSENDQYVTVSPDGVVTAVGLKKAAEDSDEVVPVSVYVRYKNGADECKVTVLPLAAAKVEIVAESEVVNVNPGESITLKVKCYPENADLTAVTWSTDYAAVATVDSATGKVTGVAPGFARIRASYNDKVYDEINVNVNAIAATSVEVDPSSVALSVGEKKRLTAVFTPSNATDKPVWTSENLDVATVDSETGVVAAVSLGTAKIKVQAGSVSATCVVNVK